MGYVPQTYDTVTVTPSGDMARKELYDRNADAVIQFYSATLGSHGNTTRWSYTVPANHITFTSLIFLHLYILIATAGRVCTHRVNVTPSGGGAKIIAYDAWTATAGNYANSTFTYSAPSYLFAGDNINYQTTHNDTASHTFAGSCSMVEFDV
jgi:hypothetical protein